RGVMNHCAIQRKNTFASSCEEMRSVVSVTVSFDKSEHMVTPVSRCAAIPIPASGMSSHTPSSSEHKVGPVGGNFGNKPAVRIEGVAGANNDINVLDNSPLFDDLLEDKAPVAPFVRQESARKDVERAFGVLQGRWGIIQQPARQYHVNNIRRIMYSCIIMHNMNLEDQKMAVTDWNEMYANPSRNMQRRGVMNHCGIQRKNTFASSCEEMRSVVSVTVSFDKSEHMVCPKPRRIGLFNTSVNEPVRP
nr:putative nuclease HARBI1 isoform X2 [Tanacetum cinerariifolium]